MAYIFIFFALLSIFARASGITRNSDKNSTPQLAPFVSDGCSVPSHLTRSNYDKCCLQHDIAYWKGGSFADKNEADVTLVNCIRKNGAGNFTAGVWQAMLQNFGAHRWGARWTPRRKNEPLTESEYRQIRNLSQKSFLSQIPVVKDFSTGKICPAPVREQLNLKTKVSRPEKTICYDLIPERNQSNDNLYIAYSDSCKDGYFVYQSQPQRKTESLAGYGMCADQIAMEYKTSSLPASEYKTLPSPNGAK